MMKKISKSFAVFGMMMAVALFMLVISPARINDAPDKSVQAAGIVDYSAREDGSGSGTELDPYIIGSQAKLVSLLSANATTQNKYYVLQKDITMTTAWTPMTSFARNSVIDGNGFTIFNMTVNTGTDRAMFINFHGSMKNITFDNYTVASGGTNGSFLIANMTTSPGANTTMNFENIKIVNSSLTASGRTGGFLGTSTSGFSGKSDADKIKINIINCAVEAAINGTNCTSGFLGYTYNSSYIELIIKNSYYKGNIQSSSNLIGGIIGGCYLGASSTGLIENCFAKGTMTSGGTYAAGLVGGKSATNSLVFKNCYVDMTITSRAPISALCNVESGNPPQVQNCYYNSTLFNGAVMNSGTATNPTGQTAGQPGSFMATADFVNWLNAGQNPAVWMWTPDGAIQIALSGIPLTNTVVLDANGGKFGSENLTQEVVFEPDQTWADVTTLFEDPSRAGYKFEGWNTYANGTGAPYANLEDIPCDNNIIVYAQWSKKPYTILLEGEGVTPANNQVIDVCDDTTYPNQKITSLQIGQTGYIQTYISVSGGYEYFIGFMAKSNNTSQWVNLGTGEPYTGSGALNKEQRFYFDEQLCEELIKDYGFHDTDIIEFKACYGADAPFNVTFDANFRNMGSLLVDGAPVTFGSTISYSSSAGSATIRLEAIGGAYYKADGIIINIDGTNIYYPDSIYDLTLEDYMDVKITVEFGLRPFDLMLTSKSGDTEISSRIITDMVQLGSAMNHGQLEEFIPVSADMRYRLASNNIENYKIFNKITGQYDYFSAMNRTINIAGTTINEDFFKKYLNTNGLEIIIEYVSQYAFDITIQNQGKGSISSITATTPSGLVFEYLHSDMELFYDAGTVIKIVAVPGEGSRFGDMSATINPSEIFGRTITIILTGSRTVSIVFEAADYAIHISAIDVFGDLITDTTKAEVTTNSQTIVKDGELRLNPTHAAGYTFMGWYAIKGGEQIFISKGNPSENYNLVRDINNSFIGQYVDGYDVYIVGVFAKIFSVDIETLDNIGGDFTIETYTYDEAADKWEWLPSAPLANYEASTLIRITGDPDEFYKLKFIDGLYSPTKITIGGNEFTIEEVIGNCAIIQVDGIRNITLEFTPQKYTVVLGKNLKEAKGSLSANKTEVALGDTITLSFAADGGYQLDTWKIDSSSVNPQNNAITITVTKDWLEQYLTTDGMSVKIDNIITTTMNKTYLTALLAAMVGIPLLILGLVLMLIANSRKKKAYAVALERSNQKSFGLNQQDFLKNLTGKKG